MKKFCLTLLVLTCAVCLCYSLTACGGKNPAPSVTPSVEQSVAPSAVPSAAPSETPAETTYTIIVLYPDGTPAVGVMVQACNDTNCYPFLPNATDANGSATKTLATDSTLVAKLMGEAPAGYTANAEGYPFVNGVATITLTEVQTVPSVEPSLEPEEPTDAELLAAVTFSNRTVRYNGAYQKLEVKNLPEGAEVVYSVNDATTSETNVEVYDVEAGAKFPGVYGITATVTLGEASVELSAILTLNKAKLTITADNKTIDLYAPHPEFTYTVSGLQGEDEFYPGQDPSLLPEEGEETVDPTVEASTTPSLEEAPDASADPSIAPSVEPEIPVVKKASFTGWLTLSTTAERYSEAGLYDITVEGLTSDCYDITFKKGKLTINTYTTDLVVGGLKQNGNNQMTYNGKVVKWQGVNYFGLFGNCFSYSTGSVNEAGVQNCFRGLEELAAYNVKAIRFSCGFFYSGWWNACYMQNEQQKIDTMYLVKRLFNKAASLNIGLIPSVFWTGYIHEVVGEGVRAWGDPNSKTIAFAMQYQRDLMDAVNDHPALFMWEFGNEWNLGQDLGGTTATDNHVMRQVWTEVVNERNTYNRVIGSGDAIMRSSAWNLYNNGSWSQDTIDQHREIIRYINPGITAVSAHIYTDAHLPLLMKYLVAEEEARRHEENPQNIMTDAEKDAYRMQIRRDYFENPGKYTDQGGLFDQYGVRNGYT
ncbi:MAG: hypothetical protein IIW27_02500, partial [Clostridia bacterium]|nr:hypothetical protein [Clostridia bacterium]